MLHSLSNRQKIVLLTYMVWLLSLFAGVHGHFAVTDTSSLANFSVSMDLVEEDDLTSHALNPHIDIYNDTVQPQKNHVGQPDFPSILTAFVFLFLVFRRVGVFCFFYVTLPLCRIIGWRPPLRAPPAFIV